MNPNGTAEKELSEAELHGVLGFPRSWDGEMCYQFGWVLWYVCSLTLPETAENVFSEDELYTLSQTHRSLNSGKRAHWIWIAKDCLYPHRFRSSGRQSL